MALIQCKECGERISKKAKECPKCGAPQGRTWTIREAFYVIILLLFIYSLFSGNDRRKVSTTPKPSISVEKKALLTHCAEELVEKNRSMIFPTPVGAWDMMEDVEAYIENGRVKLVYKTNHLFTAEKRKGLEQIQKVYMKNAGCSPSDLRTWAERVN